MNQRLTLEKKINPNCHTVMEDIIINNAFGWKGKLRLWQMVSSQHSGAFVKVAPFHIGSSSDFQKKNYKDRAYINWVLSDLRNAHKFI